MIAQADLLQSLMTVTPTGVTRSITNELATHLRSVGMFMAGGEAVLVVHDKASALAALIVSFSLGGSALDELGVDAEAGVMHAHELLKTLVHPIVQLVVEHGDITNAEIISEVMVDSMEQFTSKPDATNID